MVLVGMVGGVRRAVSELKTCGGCASLSEADILLSCVKSYSSSSRAAAAYE
jgi:hypothetical protein